MFKAELGRCQSILQSECQRCSFYNGNEWCKCWANSSDRCRKKPIDLRVKVCMHGSICICYKTVLFLLLLLNYAYLQEPAVPYISVNRCWHIPVNWVGTDLSWAGYLFRYSCYGNSTTADFLSWKPFHAAIYCKAYTTKDRWYELLAVSEITP